MFSLENVTIMKNKCVGPGLYELECFAPQVADKGEPGQFIHIEINPYEIKYPSPFLRRPFSFYEIDKKQGRVSILYRVRGEGTSIMAKMQTGEGLNVLGPLGKGFTLPTGGSKALLIGGGMGIAPLVYLADSLSQINCDITVLYGAETASELVALKALRQKGAKCFVATDDGSRGYKGPVTSILSDVIKRNKILTPDIIYSCGPLEVIAYVVSFAKEQGIPGEASLESHMACGVGVCLGCALKLKPDDVGYTKVCNEGPVFSFNQLGFPGSGEV
jgi:dihydroorotate dehydrogenase electron transfer subunit